MNKKLILLVAGTLSVVAFTALPSVASAGEPIATCFESGGTTAAKATCTGVVQGTGNTTLEDDNETAIQCSATSGTADLTSGTSTGSVSLKFTGCKAAVFFTCASPGAASGEIIINNLVTHLIYLHPINGGATTDVGIKITSVNTTFICASFANKTVTGKVIGRLTNPECNVAKTNHTVIFEKSGTGIQKYTQATTTGTTTDLTAGSDPADSTTSSQVGEGHIYWDTGTEVKIDC